MNNDFGNRKLETYSPWEEVKLLENDGGGGGTSEKGGLEKSISIPSGQLLK